MALLLLAGCFSQDDVTPLRPFDAGVDATLAGEGGIFFGDAGNDAEAGPIFKGGAPFACGTCTCDGTLYGCVEGFLIDGGCPGGGGPPMPFADSGVDDASSSCGANKVCWELPVACLPKPTCDCIAKATGLECSVDPSGDGFLLFCPPPPP